MAIPTGSDTPDGVLQQNPGGPCGEGDCFYEGLSPEYWQMLVHKVNGENPVSYSKLLLAAQKLEKWVKTTDPLLPKITTAGSLSITHSHLHGNLFPSGS